MLTCRDAISRLADLEDGELARADRQNTRRHLAGCEGCLPYWRSYRTTVALARRAYSEEDPANLEMPEELVGEVLAHARTLSRFLASARYAFHVLSGVAAAPLLALWLR